MSINLSLARIVDFVRALNKRAKLFQAGGSLLSHPTQDIDILVQYPGYDTGEILEHCKRYREFGFDGIKVLSAYEEGEVNPEEPPFKMPELKPFDGSFLLEADQQTKEKYDMVIKVVREEMIFDLLISYDFSIDPEQFLMRRFSFFPLSIQQIAKDLTTDKMYRSQWQRSEVIYYASKGKSYQKYRKYYPDKEFSPIPKPEINYFPF